MEKINFDFNVPQDPYIELYGPDNKLIMRTNDDRKFLWICCQIKDAHVDGYYVVVPEEMEKARKQNPDAEIIKHKITPYGRLKLNGYQIFHVYSELLRKLI